MMMRGTLTGAPDPAKKGVDQEDAGPPVAPEGGEGKVVGAILGSQEQHSHNEGIYIYDEVVVQLAWPEVTANNTRLLRMNAAWLLLYL